MSEEDRILACNYVEEVLSKYTRNDGEYDLFVGSEIKNSQTISKKDNSSLNEKFEKHKIGKKLNDSYKISQNSMPSQISQKTKLSPKKIKFEHYKKMIKENME